MSTKYWNKKATFFANKCQEQKDMNDNRILRKYINPKTKEAGETWEHQQQDFNGLVESLYIEESEYGNTLNFGLQGDGYVNVLQFKLFKQSGGLTPDIVKIARVIQNVDFNKELDISIWENFKNPYKNKDGETKIPVYLMLKQDDGGKWPKSCPSSFEYDEANRCYVGMPEVEKRSSMGKDVFDTTKRDEFLYAIIEKVIKDNKSIFDSFKEARPQTPAEVKATTDDDLLSGSDDLEDSVPF